jgi:hypothetical protein
VVTFSFNVGRLMGTIRGSIFSDEDFLFAYVKFFIIRSSAE